MRYTLKTIAFFAAVIATTHAAPTEVAAVEHVEPGNSTVKDMFGGWAQFCDDADCSVNCGVSVDVENPDCLIESSRKSVKFHGAFAMGAVALLASPGEECICQSSCVDSPWGYDNVCFSLDEYPGQSYRFVHKKCSENQC